MQLSQSRRPATYHSSTSSATSLPGNSAANNSTANNNSSNNSTAALPSSNSSRMAKLQRQNASSAANQHCDSAEQLSPNTQLISPVSQSGSIAAAAAPTFSPILPPTLPPISPSTNWPQSAPKCPPKSAPKSPPKCPPESPPTFSSPSPFAFATSPAAKPPNRLRPFLSLPPLPLLLLLLILVACGGSSQLPGADGLQLMLGKRRMCGIVLTQELRRVCTKQGTKGPCIHGHLGEHQRKRRSLQFPAEEDSTTFWVSSSSASRNSRASRATSMFAAKWHQLFELREEQKQQRQLERQQMAQQIVGNGGGGSSRQRPSVAQLQTLLDQAIFKHIFLDHRGGSDGVFAAASSTSQPLTAAAADDEFIGQRRKRMRIADKCCAQDGCDDKFLNSFCCDDDEQQAFQQINSM